MSTPAVTDEMVKAAQNAIEEHLRRAADVVLSPAARDVVIGVFTRTAARVALEAALAVRKHGASVAIPNQSITTEDDEIITDWFIDAHNMPGSKVQFDGGLGADPRVVCNWMDLRIIANGKTFSVLITGCVEEES